jgi:thiol peroxidase
MTQERSNVITFKNNAMTLCGEDLTVGQTIPQACVIANDLSEVCLADNTNRRARIIVTVPSLDTPVCDIEAQRFNNEAAKLQNVDVQIISMDLPFAQKRWCGANSASNIQTLSDYRGAQASLALGVLIKELHLAARAVFVVDADNRITYREIVSEVTNEPNYAAALEAAQIASGALARA